MTEEEKQNTENKGLKVISRLCLVLFVFMFLSFAFNLLPIAYRPSPEVFAVEKWTGVDESVVEKYAKEHGREPVKPLIDIEHGDLPLFLFLLAGTAGGFTAGYYWRKLTETKTNRRDTEENL